MALTQMAEQINSKFSAQNQQNLKKPDSLPNGIKSTSESVDLDNLFAFLSEVTPNGQTNSNAIISEIGEKMNNLVEDLDVELESVIQQEIEGLTNERNHLESKIQQQNQQNIQQQQAPQPQQNHVQQQNNHAQQQQNNHVVPQQVPPPPIPGQVKMG
jgi:hypothetical protein